MEKSKQTFVDTEYSSGDSKMIKSKQKFTEENNNEVDELTKNFSEMGCIVNPDKQPSNICIETCVYESEDEDQNDKEDAYSDEFEDDKSEEEELKLDPVSPKSSHESNRQNELAMKLTNSRSSMSSKPPATISGRSTSTSSGSHLFPTSRRNMSFSNQRVREIERHNHILLRKILAARNTAPSSIPPPAPPAPHPRGPPAPAPATLQRKLAQRKIDHENLILLKKIQRAKSSALGARR